VVSEEKAKASEAVGTNNTREAAKIRSGRSQVLRTTPHSGDNSTPSPYKHKAGRVVIRKR
jgi:hypothetical protein